MQPGLFWRIWAVIRSWFPAKVAVPDIAFSEADLAAVRAIIEKPFDWLGQYGPIWKPGSTAFWLAPTEQNELDSWHAKYSGKRILVDNPIHGTALKAKKKSGKKGRAMSVVVRMGCPQGVSPSQWESVQSAALAITPDGGAYSTCLWDVRGRMIGTYEAHRSGGDWCENWWPNSESVPSNYLNSLSNGSQPQGLLSAFQSIATQCGLANANASPYLQSGTAWSEYLS